jgi:hypothetical protein
MFHIVKIQSISDIITNSSSEVFPIVRYKWGAEEDIESLINAILTAGGSEYTCEDLFDLEVDGSFLNVTPKITTKNVVKVTRPRPPICIKARMIICPINDQ